jgi:hypothetical protein
LRSRKSAVTITSSIISFAEDIEKEEIKQTTIKIPRIAKKNNDIAFLFLRRY